jgi:hypothetical protein
MACQQFAEDLIDAALGSLDARRETELRAHLAACPACRQHLEAQQRLAMAMDRGLAASVAAEPSLEFAARVRQRIAAEPVPSRRWWLSLRPSEWSIRIWVPVGAAAAMVLAAAFWFAPPQRVRTPDLPAPQIARTGPSAVSLPPAQVPLQVVPGAIRPGDVRKPAPPWIRHNAVEVLVPRGEKEAVLRLLVALNKGRVDGDSLAAPEKPSVVPDLTIKPLDVPALDFDGKPSESGRESAPPSEPHEPPRSL